MKFCYYMENICVLPPLWELLSFMLKYNCTLYIVLLEVGIKVTSFCDGIMYHMRAIHHLFCLPPSSYCICSPHKYLHIYTTSPVSTFPWAIHFYPAVLYDSLLHLFLHLYLHQLFILQIHFAGTLGRSHEHHRIPGRWFLGQ